jgi:hypothetical protein
MSSGESDAGLDEFTKSLVQFYELELSFAQNLQFASLMYENEDRLEGARLACIAVAKFIDGRSPGAKALAVPFMAMADGFAELKAGGIPDVFSSSRLRKKRPRTEEHRHVVRFATACFDVLCSLDKAAMSTRGLPIGELEVATLVARHVDKWPTLSEMKVKPGTLIGWRKEQRTKAGKPAELYRRMVSAMRSEPTPSSMSCIC